MKSLDPSVQAIFRNYQIFFRVKLSLHLHIYIILEKKLRFLVSSERLLLNFVTFLASEYINIWPIHYIYLTL